MSSVYLNGDFVPLDQACVPVLDRGFLLGDGVYEVIPVYGGRPFRLAQHLARLQHSLDGVRIPNPLDENRWAQALDELIRHHGGGDQSVYLQVTRGVAVKRDHAFPHPITPTVFMMSTPLAPPEEHLLSAGVAAVTRADTRWQHCDIKAITLLPNVLLRQEAVDAGAAEAILIRDGEATEGAASNLFIVADGTLITPPKSAHLLPGITRDLILELAQAHDIPWREQAIPEQALRSAREVWVSSSTREILPVTTLDGKPVGDGTPGPVWARMHAIYQDYKQTLSRAADDQPQIPD
ncbi:MAG: D-amino acid aminotransferase [Gammaproteobacteria bacterium]